MLSGSSSSSGVYSGGCYEMYVGFGVEKSRVGSEIRLLNVTVVTGLPPKQIGTTCRGADFDGVPPWMALN
jgi:hypothetical protein